MALPTVQAAQAKYAANGGAAGQYWQQGAANFQGDPTALAAAALPKALQNYTAAINSGRVARGLAAAGKQGWLAGINNPNAVSAFQGGITGKGQAKWGAKMQIWFPIFTQLKGQIDAMPKQTTQDSINRVAAWINGTIAAKQQL
jgi:hypothetical protein